MRSIKKLIRRTFDLTTYFSFQRTSCNPKCAIFQGGVINHSTNKLFNEVRSYKNKRKK